PSREQEDVENQDREEAQADRDADDRPRVVRHPRLRPSRCVAADVERHAHGPAHLIELPLLSGGEQRCGRSLNPHGPDIGGRGGVLSGLLASTTPGPAGARRDQAGWRLFLPRPSFDGSAFAQVALPFGQPAAGLLSMKTYAPKPREIERRWYVIDAQGSVLGRLAAETAKILRGKDKPTFAPHADTGDHVGIVNAREVRRTGGKEDKKVAYRHFGHPG